MTYAATLPPDVDDVADDATSEALGAADGEALAAGAAMEIGWSLAFASGLTSLTAPPQSVVG